MWRVTRSGKLVTTSNDEFDIDYELTYQEAAGSLEGFISLTMEIAQAVNSVVSTGQGTIVDDSGIQLEITIHQLLTWNPRPGDQIKFKASLRSRDDLLKLFGRL